MLNVFFSPLPSSTKKVGGIGNPKENAATVVNIDEENAPSSDVCPTFK